MPPTKAIAKTGSHAVAIAVLMLDNEAVILAIIPEKAVENLANTALANINELA